MRLPASLRVWASALALAALAGAACRDAEVAEPEPGAPAAAPAPPETGADALAVRALVASYLERKPEEVDWDAPLARYGLDDLDASDMLLVVESELDLEIRNQDLETLVGSADVGGLNERLTTRIVVRLAELGRAAR